MSEIWEKQPNEPEKAYAAFRIYLEDRNLSSVARRAGKPHTTISNWAKKANWVARADAWDTWRNKIAFEAQKLEVEKTAKRHVQGALTLQEKGLAALERLEPEQISPQVAIKMLEVGIAIERKASGDPQEILNRLQQQTSTSNEIDFSKLSDEEIEQYERIISKAAAND